MFKSNIVPQNGIPLSGKFNFENIDNPLVVLSGAAKTYGLQELFTGVDMVVNNDDRIAIVGPNGVGKSTLLKIIMGIEETDEGSISRNKDIRFGYLPQETAWESLENEIITEMKAADKDIFDAINKKKEYEILLADTGRKDLKAKISEYGNFCHKYEASKGFEYERRAEEILEKFNFPEKDWTRKVKSLSGGERTRLALAKIILCRPNILILDEPTNHLDMETIIWLESFLAEWNMAVIAISHDKHFLDAVCDKIFELSKTGIEKYCCRYSEYLVEKAENDQKKEEAAKRQEKQLERQNDFIERFRYKATKARAVQSRIKMVDKIEKIEAPEKAQKKIKIRLKDSGGLPSKVLEVKDLVIGEKDAPLAMMAGLWEINREDKIGIIGANGAGKSTLLKVLVGKGQALEGKIQFFGRTKIGYYAQAHEELDPKKTILDEMNSKTEISEEKVRGILGALLFSGEDVHKEVSALSGGERARVAIAELILTDSNMLLLDEPTNHLDLPSKDAVAEVLKDFNGPIIMVSHDRSVLNKVCNIIWEVKDNEIRKYLGNYDDYKYKTNN